jgi:carbon monoxide dehydrogenase subunit G
MLHVTRQKNISGAAPDDVFTVLSNPDGLTRLLPRLRKAEVYDKHDNQARMSLHISIGSVFGTLRFEGNLHWSEPYEIKLSIQNPLPANIHWTLSSTYDHETNVNVTISLDLKPLLGPMVNFVPLGGVEDMIGKDLEHALREIEKHVESEPRPYLCDLPQFCLVPHAGFA